VAPGEDPEFKPEYCKIIIIIIIIIIISDTLSNSALPY
jgi:hypothetical protein